MPEGITYLDMKRMLIAQIPPGLYRIESQNSTGTKRIEIKTWGTSAVPFREE